MEESTGQLAARLRHLQGHQKGTALSYFSTEQHRWGAEGTMPQMIRRRPAQHTTAPAGRGWRCPRGQRPLPPPPRPPAEGTPRKGPLLLVRDVQLGAEEDGGEDVPLDWGQRSWLCGGTVGKANGNGAWPKMTNPLGSMRSSFGAPLVFGLVQPLPLYVLF